MGWTPATIRALKDRLGMTWVAFADACGVTSRTARYWVLGNGTKPGRNAREKLDALNDSARDAGLKKERSND
jgi:DNA-binding transcriptional regulator YiaG